MSDATVDPTVDGDELVGSPRCRGRKVRSVSDPFSRGVSPRAPKCRECPKHDAEHSVCPLMGAHQCGSSTACRYGIILIRAKRMADRRAGSTRR